MIIRSPRRKSYTVVDNATINDGLPLETLGLLVYLLSKNDNWSVNVTHLTTQHNVGKNKIYRMLAELCDAGYASFKRHNSGKTEWIVSEVPDFTPHPQNRDKPHPQKPDQEKPCQENRDVLINKERTIIKERTVSKEQRDLAFDRWYQIYPVKKSKQPARKKFHQITSGMTLVELDSFTDQLIQHCELMMRHDAEWLRGYIPHPSTYLNQERWLDEPAQPKPEDLTEAQKYELRQQRTAAILQELNDSTLGHHVEALPPAMAEDEW